MPRQQCRLVPFAVAFVAIFSFAVVPLAQAANSDGSVSILLGQGDGTFNLLNSAISLSDQSSRIEVADFNGDGEADLLLALGGYDSGALAVFLGKGDGTFTATPAIDATTTAYSPVIADFNGDGIPDFAVTNPYGRHYLSGPATATARLLPPARSPPTTITTVSAQQTSMATISPTCWQEASPTTPI